MNHYTLYVKIDGVWTFQFRIRARAHSDAFQQAMQMLKPEHYKMEVRLEQEGQATESEPKESG